MKVDRLIVNQYNSRPEMGENAGKQVAEKIRTLQTQQDKINIIFASAPSQNEFLTTLRNEEGLDWKKVHAFHMDEYLGLADDAPQNFGTFLKENLFKHIPVGQVSYIQGNATSFVEECDRYAQLLLDHPIDIVCMGIGENGHIAFNDPHVAEFNDPSLVKKVSLDHASRQQQVNDGCFSSLKDVPTEALTLTIPALVAAKYLFCMVPGINKATAIYNTIHQEVDEAYPSTIIRNHPNAQLFIDQDSGSLLRVN